MPIILELTSYFETSLIFPEMEAVFSTAAQSDTVSLLHSVHRRDLLLPQPFWAMERCWEFYKGNLNHVWIHTNNWPVKRFSFSLIILSLAFTLDLFDGSLRDARDDLQKQGFHPIPPGQILKPVPEVILKEPPEPQRPNAFVLPKPVALVSSCLGIETKGHITIKNADEW